MRVLHPRHVLLAVACAVLAGCVSSSGPSVREAPLEPGTLGLAATSAAPAVAWWESFGDPQLDRLVRMALARNAGLAASLARVRSAREQAIIAGAAGAPQVTLEGHEYRERTSENYVYPPPYGGATFWDGQLGLSLAWQLDFWGRQAALVAQASRLADAAAFEASGSELLLSGAVAQAYLDYVRGLQLEEVSRRAQAQRREVGELTLQRVRAGLDSQVEAKAAESNYEQTGVDIELARLAQESARHALAALTGQSAAASMGLETPRIDLANAVPVPAALPLDLLARRPDIRAARARIDAATAGRAAAHASFYPNLDLSGFVGVTALSLEDLLHGDSLQWSIGPAVHLPIFDAGRLRAEYRRSGAELDAAVATYNDVVLRAIREAADQVSRVRSLEAQLAAQERALAAAEQGYDYAKQRYGAGLASQVAVLNAETQVLAGRRQRTQLLADRAGARIALLVALGGHLSEEPVR